MRRLADALPTLREALPAAVPLLPPPGSGEGFDPAAIVRALAARRVSAFPRPQTLAADDVRHDAPSAPGSPSPRHDGVPEPAPRASGSDVTETLPRTAALPAPLAPRAPEGRSAADVARERLAALAASHARRPAEPAAAAKKPAASPIPHLDPPKEGAEDLTATAVAEALKRAEEETARAVEAARAEERASAEHRLAEARADWVARQAEPLAAAMTGAFETLHERLSDAFGKALAPLADGAVRERALRRFASVVDDLAGDGATRAAITVRGPADLVQALSRIMGERPAIAFEAADTTELVVTLGDTRVETVIGAWADDLARALGQSA